jgi:hypothetical protein
MKKLTCALAKQIDLVNYLASLGYQPQSIRNENYWYNSPLRDEHTPSFKVDRKLNLWYDHGTGHGGDLIDFGTQYFRCGISDFLLRISQQQTEHAFSFQPQTQQEVAPAAINFAGERKEESKIAILENRPLTEPSLLDYLKKRCIPQDIADRYCREVDFLLYGKIYTVIGFENNTGGYDLRSENFKGSSAPKDITLIDNHTEYLAVFEGFFNFLSHQTINQNKQLPLPNCLVLNSLSFFERSRPLMEKYRQVHLNLDRDAAGIKHTQEALKWSGRYIDRSHLYQGHKDLNEWLLPKERKLKQGQRFGRSF